MAGLVIYIQRGVFVARFDRSGKFEDLKAGTGNSGVPRFSCISFRASVAFQHKRLMGT